MDEEQKDKNRPQPIKEVGAVVQSQALRERRVARKRTIRREERNGQILLLVDVTVAEAGRVNRNRRLYPLEAWQAAVGAAQTDIQQGKLWGLLEHEEGDWYGHGPAKGRLRNIALLFDSLYLDGSVVKATAVLPDTEAGNILRGLIEAGVAVGISSSGTASVQYLPAKEVLNDPDDPDELIEVIQNDFRLDTIDAVGDPSDPSGLVRAIESVRRAGEPPPPKPILRPSQDAPVEPERAKETYVKKVHPKLSALADRLGKTLEQVKTENEQEYQACLESIAEERAEVAEQVGRVPGLQNEVERLKRELEQAQEALAVEQRERERESRTAMVDRLIAEAELPLIPVYRDGDIEVDVNAEFRNAVVEAAVAAESDEAASALAASRVARRKHELGARSSVAEALSSQPRHVAAASLPEGADPTAAQEEAVQENALLKNSALAQRLRS